MFERYTPAARQVVMRGQQEARTFRHPWLGTEHLVLGILAQPEEPGLSVLTELGVNLDACRAALSQLVGRGGLLSPGSRDSDADALPTLGIDLDEVRRRVEASFGPGALDPPARRRVFGARARLYDQERVVTSRRCLPHGATARSRRRQRRPRLCPEVGRTGSDPRRRDRRSQRWPVGNRGRRTSGPVVVSPRGDRCDYHAAAPTVGPVAEPEEVSTTRSQPRKPSG